MSVSNDREPSMGDFLLAYTKGIQNLRPMKCACYEWREGIWLFKDNFEFQMNPVNVKTVSLLEKDANNKLVYITTDPCQAVMQQAYPGETYRFLDIASHQFITLMDDGTVWYKNKQLLADSL